MVKVPISNGELIDKISILKIKEANIKDSSKLSNIKKELGELSILMKGIDFTIDHCLFKEIYAINLELWEIEDKIRLKEKAKEFDKEFIDLARSIYVTNDKRASVKKEIDLITKSSLTEEKSYEKYR